MTKKSKMILALASMLGVSAGATAISGFAWFITTKSATVEITNIGVYSTSSGLDVRLNTAEALKGVEAAATTATGHSFDLVGTTTSMTQTFKATSAGQAEYTLQKYAAEITSVTIGSDATTAYDYSEATKKVTLQSSVLSSVSVGTVVTIVYEAYGSLTDISSTDGQTFYKPTWTAGNPGLYATAMPTVTDGYVEFTMTLTASGSDNLDIYLNHASITAAVSGDLNTAAANIARVAFIDGSTTVLVGQNAVNATNNKGIDSSFAKNYDPDTTDDDDTKTQWDLSALDKVPTKLAAFDQSAKDTWSTGSKTTTENFICTVNGLSSKNIKVAIWLEGTSGNETDDASGEFDEHIEDAMIKVNLPLIAFTAAA